MISELQNVQDVYMHLLLKSSWFFCSSTTQVCILQALSHPPIRNFRKVTFATFFYFVLKKKKRATLVKYLKRRCSFTTWYRVKKVQRKDSWYQVLSFGICTFTFLDYICTIAYIHSPVGHLHLHQAWGRKQLLSKAVAWPGHRAWSLAVVFVGKK